MRERLGDSDVVFEEHDLHINDEAFADLLAERVLADLKATIPV